MRKFIVNSKIVGRRNVVFNPGDVIDEIDVPHNHLQSLLNRGFLTDASERQPPITGKIKLAIVTSVWGRPEILHYFMYGIKQLLMNCDDFEISLVISQSLQQDKTYSDTTKPEFYDAALLKYGIKHYQYIEIPNEPLAAKVNATTYACRNLDVHYVLCMGSDDIITPELLNHYAQYMRKGIDFIGVTDCYFYDTVSKKALYWGGYREQYRKGHTAGAFRAISARLLSKWDWMPWENKDSHVLDKSMQDKLKVTPHTIHTFAMRDHGLFALDIKSSTNMTPFKKWDNSEFIDVKIIKDQFHYLF